MRLLIAIYLLSGPLLCGLANPDTRQLQKVLDSGTDLILEKGRVYEIDTTLRLTTRGQRIYTGDAKGIRDFATLRIKDPELVTIICAEGVSDIVIERVFIDGNRQNMRPPGGRIPMQPFISLGKSGGDDQSVKNCILLNVRCSGGWAAIHVHEDAFRTIIRDNIIFGSGTDVLGNGRSSLEYPFGWGDGISCAAGNSKVINNLIIDATDEGIMVQGAPGTKVMKNVIVALSREVLGGIALIDPAQYCLMDSIENIYDYRGVSVRENLVHALGARVHIGFPCGMDVWNYNPQNKIITGAEILNNKMTGNVGGYGMAVCNVKDFMITHNVMDAVFEEPGDGLPQRPPDPASAFIYEPSKTYASKIQEEFMPAQEHIIHLLRNFRKPVNESGYRILDHYGEVEAKTIVSVAFKEMLDRLPSDEETTSWVKWLQASMSNADALRVQLMLTPEFRERHGDWRMTQLQECRARLFMQEIYSAFNILGEKEWPDAHELHDILFAKYDQTKAL